MRKPILEPIVQVIDGQTIATTGWTTTLYLFDHPGLVYAKSTDWRVRLNEDFREWLSHTDPECEIVEFNSTTLILRFATEQGAFAFKMRYC
ncbi:MAG: hypothetical protein EOP83_00290 [Verrucomicrobiaceae bacterium]|nr:MAG: hypothetical protein EOP83_00290 [Verrucomicrobiaceae bacterium]